MGQHSSLTGQDLQEKHLVGATYKLDYLRSGYVKFCDQ